MVILTMNALLTAGGIGGGAAYVPYIMLFFSVTLKQAIAYAYACVFGGGVGNLVNIISLRNPKTKRFMINYDVNLVILPALMVGVMIGIILNRMFPPLLTNIILLLVLAYSLTKNVSKAKANLLKEKKEREAKKLKALETEKAQTQSIALTEAEPRKNEEAETEKPGEPGEETTNLRQQSEENNVNVNVVSEVNANPVGDDNEAKRDPLAERRAQLELQEQKFPYHKLFELLLNVLVIIIVGLIRGTKNFKPIVGVEFSCGWDFLWFAIGIVLFGILSIRSVYVVSKWQKEKIRVGYEFFPEEPKLTLDKIIKLSIGSVAAGIIGAIIALGGALVIAPTLLDMGIPPAYTAVTTGLFMIFSMFNSMFQTILNKNLKGNDLAWFLPLAFAFSFISSKLVNYYVKKTGRQSAVIMSVMLVTALGFGCVVYKLIDGLIDDSKFETTFTSIC